MRKYIIIICLISFTLSLYSQVQHGIIKTLGRPEKKGIPLGSVTVRVQGEHNAVLSGEDGKFSVTFTGKSLGDAYTLQQVKKMGYELNDAGMIGRRLAYSDKVPLTIVMVSSAQLEADKRKIENTAYQVAEKNYKSKLALMEKQLEDGTLKGEQYRKELSDLQNKFGKYQSLINDLADHYAHADYDMLNEKEREINLCIENGELERADSLLHLIFNPDGVLERNVAALARINQSEREGQKLLEQAKVDMEKVLRQQDKDAEYLYQLFTIATANFDNEKARFYIETRAELDTTNVEWQKDAGEYIEIHLADYNKAMSFFNRALISPNISEWERIICMTDIGSIQEYRGKYAAALQTNEETLKLAEEFRFKICAAVLCHNIGNEYRYLEDYKKSIIYLDKSLKLWDSITEEDLHAVKTKISKAFYLVATHSSLAKTYDITNQSEKALSHLDIALNICKTQSKDMSSSLAGIYSVMGDVYNSKKDYEKSITNYNDALRLYTKIYGEKHPYVGIIYNNIGDSYGMLDDSNKALEYIQKAVNIKEACYGERHPSTALGYGELGGAYFLKGDKNNALKYFYRALEILKETYDESNRTIKDIQNAIDAIKSTM